MKHIQVIPSAIVLHYRVPDIILNDLHNYTEEVLEDKQYHDKRNAEPFLAADIRQQYFLNQNDPRVLRYCDWQQTKAGEYIEAFTEHTKMGQWGTGEGYPDCEIKTEDIWSVHSFESEYNPIHSHNVETGYGLATVTYTKLPEIMKIHKPEDEARYNEYGLFKDDLAGITDGYISLQAGPQKNLQQLRNFETTQQIAVRPEVGLMVMFPIWMNHCVYPFKGKGERRSVASNLVIDIKGDLFPK